MKKFLLSAALAFVATGVVLAQAVMSPLDKVRLNDFRLKVAQNAEALAPASRAGQVKNMLPITIELRDGYTADDLAAAGMEVQGQLGNFVRGSVSLDNFDALVGSKAAALLSVDEELQPTNDAARSWCNIDAIHAGDGLPQAYTGRDVLFGIFDVGIDFNHINFKDANGNSRILRAWTYNGTKRTDYKTPAEIANLTTGSQGQDHGSHTLGIAAGSYKGTVSGRRYTKYPLTQYEGKPYGVAPDANILAADGTSYSSNMVDAIQEMLKVAAEVGKPLVVNLSFGNNWGTHDGTSTVNKQFDALADMGAIICFSAGNEGDEDMAVKFTPTSADQEYSFVITPATPQGGSNTLTGSVGIFAADNQKFDMRWNFWDSKTKKALGSRSYTSCDTDKSEGTGTINLTSLWPGMTITRASGIDANSNRYMRIITFEGGSKPSNTQYMIVTLKGFTPGKPVEIYKQKAGNLTFAPNAVNCTDTYNFATPTADGSVSDLACGKNALVIGAFNSRSLTYVDALIPISEGYTEGNIAEFSSWGTLVDGRKLPHVSAPGSWLMSSVNRYSTGYSSNTITVTVDGQTYHWGDMSGTSMASPFAAGTIATWLQAKPSLTPAEARDVLMRTVSKPSGFDNSVQWGAGLVDGLAGIKDILNISGIDDILDSGKQPMLVQNLGNNIFEVFLASQSSVSVKAYGITGALAAQATANGDTAVLDLSSAAPGVYVITAKGASATASTKVTVK